MKRCRICLEEKEIDLFQKNSGMPDGHLNHCKSCQSKQWFSNAEANRKKLRDSYKRNREKRIKYAKEFLKDPERKRKMNEKRKINLKNRYHSDPNFKIRILLRTRLNAAFVSDAKVGSAVRDLGCSMEFFKGYIEAQFKDGMNWNNRGLGEGKWQLDHIYPVANVDLTDREQFLKVHHYTNYQPLWSHENRAKSNK